MIEERFYIHSKCCNAHWEVVSDGQHYELRCENCNEPTNLKVIGPKVDGCEQCRDKEGL